MYRQIYLDAPNVGEIEKRYLNQAIDTGYVSTIGPFVPQFEEKIAGYLGVQKGVSVQSGTAALHISLYELGIGCEDEVIVPVLTFVATVNPVKYVGATPVFVDVDADTWNIIPEEIEKKITSKTKAIIPVHFYGNPCEMDKIMNIAQKHNLYVIEDATESLGATFNNKHTGTFGALGVLSFNGNKIITTGGGGMVVGNDKERIDHIKFLVNQARDESKGYYHPEIGFNYRMTNLEAGMGLGQTERLPVFVVKKQLINSIYKNELGSSGKICLQKQYAGAQSSCWLSCIKFNNSTDITGLQEELKNKGIPSRRIFMPIVEFPPYQQNGKEGFKNAYDIYSRGLCLPSSTLNSEEDIYYVCKTIKGLV
ncbi:MAG: aminotransferase class I/II-fold pyridoxal phosphate-dependent enzyme [Candidatus Omnitrophota bacterium]